MTSLDPIEYFDAFTKRRGGRVTREKSLYPLVRHDSGIVSYCLRIARRVTEDIRTSPRVTRPVPPIYVDYVDSLEFQSIAFPRLNEHFFIGLYLGPLLKLHDYFLLVFADPTLFQDVGDPSKEVPISQRPAGMVWAPVDSARQERAQMFTLMAFDFLVRHEITHVMHGHVGYQYEKGGLEGLLDLETHLQASEKMIRQAFEMDADAWAAILGAGDAMLRVDRFEKVSPRWRAISGSYEDSFFAYLFSIHSFFLLTDEALGHPPIDFKTIGTASHPPARLRARMVYGDAATWLQHVYGPEIVNIRLLPSMIRALITAERCFMSVRGRTPEKTAPGYQDAFLDLRSHEHIRGILRTWRQIRPDLEPFAFKEIPVAQDV
ncbi:MAG: hypothetical protein ACJ796_20605 [Gemmatimonadaceae bacterium]